MTEAVATQQSSALDTRDGRLAEEQAFIARVQALDRGRQAALKRNAGNTISESHGAGWFYGLLESGQFGWDEEIFFLVATLLAQDRNALEGRRPFTGDFGRTMKQLAERGNPEGAERRFRILLDADFNMEASKPAGGELAFRLRQLVKLAASKEVGVDWPQLLYDLRRWRAPGKRVQKRWAQSFYAPSVEILNAVRETSLAG